LWGRIIEYKAGRTEVENRANEQPIKIIYVIVKELVLSFYDTLQQRLKVDEESAWCDNDDKNCNWGSKTDKLGKETARISVNNLFEAAVPKRGGQKLFDISQKIAWIIGSELESKVDEAKTFEERKNSEFEFVDHPKDDKEILAEINEMELGLEVVKCKVDQDEHKNDAAEKFGDNWAWWKNPLW
jgi:hypothetical protein